MPYRSDVQFSKIPLISLYVTKNKRFFTQIGFASNLIILGTDISEDNCVFLCNNEVSNLIDCLKECVDNLVTKVPQTNYTKELFNVDKIQYLASMTYDGNGNTERHCSFQIRICTDKDKICVVLQCYEIRDIMQFVSDLAENFLFCITNDIFFHKLIFQFMKSIALKVSCLDEVKNCVENYEYTKRTDYQELNFVQFILYKHKLIINCYIELLHLCKLLKYSETQSQNIPVFDKILSDIYHNKT